jgi:hypothetical protein
MAITELLSKIGTASEGILSVQELATATDLEPKKM